MPSNVDPTGMTAAPQPRPALPDNPIKAATRRNAYMAASVMARYGGDAAQPVLSQIAADYTEQVAMRTFNQPPPLTFDQLIMDPLFQETFRKYNVKQTPSGDLVSAKRGLALNAEFFKGVPNGLLYSTLAGVAYFAYKYFKKGGAAS